MALQQDLQLWSNDPTHFLSIERLNNICSITHSPGVSLSCVIKSSPLEYMKEFLFDIFSYVTWLLWQPRQDVQLEMLSLG